MNIDFEVIDGCKKGLRKAQFQLFQLYFGFIMSICLRYYKDSDEAKSTANLIFYKILKGIAGYKESNSFKAWIRRIATNTIIDEYRKNVKFKFHIELREGLEEQNDKEDGYNFESEIDIEVLREMINQLPSNQRLAFNMIVIDGYSYQEFADLNELNLSTVKWLVFASRKALQEKINNVYNIKKRHYVK